MMIWMVPMYWRWLGPTLMKEDLAYADDSW